MIKTNKPTTILDVIQGKRFSANRIDYNKGEQDHLWKESDKKATKAELLSAKEELQLEIETKPSAEDLASLNASIAGKAEQSEVDTLSGVVDGKADASDMSALSDEIDNKVSDSELQKKYDMIGLRGNNLITNGMGELGDRTNFMPFVLAPFLITAEDREIKAFFLNGTEINMTTEEYIPINPTKEYRMKLKGLVGGTVFFCGSAFYDYKKNRIFSAQEPSPELDATEREDYCELAQTFDASSDTIIYLKQGHAAKWVERYNKSKQGNHIPGGFRMKKVNYGDGIDFGATYMRYWAFSIWDETGVDIANDTITLKTQVGSYDHDPSGVFPAGTHIDSSCDSGGTFFDGSFLNIYSSQLAKFPFEGKISNSEDSHTRIPQRAIYFRLAIRGCQGGSGGCGVSGVELYEIVSTPQTVSAQIEAKRPDSAYKNSSIIESDIPVLPQSKITNLTTDLAGKASSTELDTAIDAVETQIDEKPDMIDINRVGRADFFIEGNQVAFEVGGKVTTASSWASELGLFVIVKSPVSLIEANLLIQTAQDVLIQIYHYSSDSVVYSETHALVTGANKLGLQIFLPTGKYFFTASTGPAIIGYQSKSEYNDDHHFVAIVGGEIDPTGFPAFSPSVTNAWTGLGGLVFSATTKSLYLGVLSAKELDTNLIPGAFYHINDGGKLRTWCYDGTSQITHS